MSLLFDKLDRKDSSPSYVATMEDGWRRNKNLVNVKILIMNKIKMEFYHEFLENSDIMPLKIFETLSMLES